MQRQAKGVASTMVGVDADGDPDRIVGFYCAIAHEFRGTELPDPWRKSTKVRDPRAVPGVLLAQLGVDRDFQRRGIAKTLIQEVFRRAVGLVENFGCAAIVADPIDQIAGELYAGFDFQPLGDGSTRMIIAMKTVVAAIAKLDEPAE